MVREQALGLEELEAGKLEALLERIQPLIQAEDFRLLQRVLATLHLLLDLIQKARLSMRRLRQLIFSPKTEKSRQVLAKAKDQAGSQTTPPASENCRVVLRGSGAVSARRPQDSRLKVCSKCPVSARRVCRNV